MSAVVYGLRQVLAVSAEGVRNYCSTVWVLTIFPNEVSLGYCPMLRRAICYGGFQFFGHDPLFASQLVTWCHEIAVSFAIRCILTLYVYFHMPVSPHHTNFMAHWQVADYSLKITKGLNSPLLPSWSITKAHASPHNSKQGPHIQFCKLRTAQLQDAVGIRCYTGCNRMW